MTGWV